jgi:hypothetical protein
VVFVGENGDYPVNEKGQKQYPRYELFQEILAAFRRAGRAVPVFCDKHLSYARAKAQAMYEDARALGVPMMAGSSTYVAGRRPAVSPPFGARMSGALTIGHPSGGDWHRGLESYGFHAVEALQAMVERRRGGESGVKAVQTLIDDAAWRWASAEGRWSEPLVSGLLPDVAARRPERAAVFAVDYQDGFRAAVYMLPGDRVRGNAFAAAFDDRPDVMQIRFGGGRGLGHFDGLVHCMEDFFLSGRSERPVERTLLAGAILDVAMESKLRGGIRIEAPELAVAYEPPARDWFQRV